jgi:hypothetical protein
VRTALEILCNPFPTAYGVLNSQDRLLQLTSQPYFLPLWTSRLTVVFIRCSLTASPTSKPLPRGARDFLLNAW